MHNNIPSTNCDFVLRVMDYLCTLSMNQHAYLVHKKERFMLQLLIYGDGSIKVISINCQILRNYIE